MVKIILSNMLYTHFTIGEIKCSLQSIFLLQHFFELVNIFVTSRYISFHENTKNSLY